MKSSLFPIILGISLSYSQQVQDIVRDNTFATKRQKVKSLLKDPNLSDKDRAALDELWNNAQRIGRLNDRCASISLTEVLDETCQTFYKVELPAFDELYGKVTNDIRMNGFSLTKNVNDERSLMTACVDALYEMDFHPSKLFKMETEFRVEPLLDGAELSYRISLHENFEGSTTRWLRNTFASLCKWNSHKEKSFVSQLAARYNEANNYPFRLDGLKIFSRRGYSFIYTINGKKVFSGKIDSKTNELFDFSRWTPGNVFMFSSSCPAKSSYRGHASDYCEGKIKLSEEDLENGYVGSLIWQED
ncbi:MAG: hypothetical protein MJZ26_00880 [Fibrobacter sp.]|nr:hypothetical protein [Fibrobacter sp.]